MSTSATCFGRFGIATEAFRAVGDPAAIGGRNDIATRKRVTGQWRIRKPDCRKRCVLPANALSHGDASGRCVGMKSGIVPSDAAETKMQTQGSGENETALRSNRAARSKTNQSSKKTHRQNLRTVMMIDASVNGSTSEQSTTGTKTHLMRRPGASSGYKQAGIWSLLRGCAVALLLLTGGVSVADEAMQLPENGNAFIFIRHALAPGMGDPVEFDVNDCNTQRNLSDTGRQQSVAIGSALREAGLLGKPVYTSQWCRCKETAELMNIGSVQEQSLLNSFFETPSDGPEQLKKLRQWLSTADETLVLVTHQVVISGMTSVYPSSGEIVVTTIDADGTLSVVSTLETGL